MKKVLIISYYWPPSGGSGVQRWLKFSKYLPENGWKPIIYTPKDPQFQLEDRELLLDVPAEAEVWKAPIWEPYALKDRIFGRGRAGQNAGIIESQRKFKHRVVSWIRGNLFIPDPRVFWVRPSINFLKKRIAEHNIGVVVTTGPPHSMHLIGLGLKRALDIRWIADFRDPWSEMDVLDQYRLSKSSRKKLKDLERDVLQTADVCLTVSTSWSKSFARLGAKRVKVITNGFDHEDRIEKDKSDGRFIIGHYGLLNHLRNPTVLWDVLSEMCKTDPKFEAQLEIHLAGMVDESVVGTIERHPLLKSKLKLLGYLNHREILKEYSSASVLLLLAFDSESGVGNIPAKVFEYFAAGRPILGFGPAESDSRELIEEVGLGTYHSYQADREALTRDLSEIVDRGESADELPSIERFSRRQLTKSLVNLFDA